MEGEFSRQEVECTTSRAAKNAVFPSNMGAMTRKHMARA